MLVDYLHKRKFPILGPIMTWTLRTATVGVLFGVYQFNTNDIGVLLLAMLQCSAYSSFCIGLTELITRVWAA
jgi:CybS, succinate dehydrogenase cytochrome B small subunit